VPRPSLNLKYHNLSAARNCLFTPYLHIHIYIFSEFQSEYFPSGLPMFWDYLHTLLPSNNPTDKSGKWIDPAIAAENWYLWVASRVWQNVAACTKVHWRTRRSFSAPSLTSKYFSFAFVYFPVPSLRPTPTLVYETAGRFFLRHSVYI
jgi:hypothetical protein